MHTASQSLRMLWQLSKFFAIHHIGVSSTNYALQLFGFDSKYQCQIAARNLGCWFLCTYSLYCSIFLYVYEIQYALLGYFLSDLVLTLRMKQFITFETYFHHLVSIVLILLAYEGEAVHYQESVIYLGGFGEGLNVIFSITDTFKRIPWLQKRYPTFNMVQRILFVLSFIYLRVGLYTYVTFRHWNSTKKEEKCFLLAILFLQYYWFIRILRQGCASLKSVQNKVRITCIFLQF